MPDLGMTLPVLLWLSALTVIGLFCAVRVYVPPRARDVRELHVICGELLEEVGRLSERTTKRSRRDSAADAREKKSVRDQAQQAAVDEAQQILARAQADKPVQLSPEDERAQLRAMLYGRRH